MKFVAGLGHIASRTAATAAAGGGIAFLQAVIDSPDHVESRASDDQYDDDGL
jgi:hypothetical protein